MEIEETLDRRSGDAAGDRPDERPALELAGPRLQLLLDQVEPEEPVGLALEALEGERFAGLLAGFGRLDQAVEVDPGRRAVALGPPGEPGAEVGGGGGGPLPGDLGSHVAPADLPLQLGPDGAEAVEGGLGLGLERGRSGLGLLAGHGPGSLGTDSAPAISREYVHWMVVAGRSRAASPRTHGVVVRTGDLAGPSPGSRSFGQYRGPGGRLSTQRPGAVPSRWTAPPFSASIERTGAGMDDRFGRDIAG